MIRAMGERKNKHWGKFPGLTNEKKVVLQKNNAGFFSNERRAKLAKAWRRVRFDSSDPM